MKSTLSRILIVGLVFTGSVLGDDPAIEINASYTGFDSVWFSDLAPGVRATAPKIENGAISLPRVLAKSGQTATIEISTQVFSRIGPNDIPECVAYGLILKLKTVLEHGRISVSGNSILRRSLRGVDGPALTFLTQETYVNGVFEDGKPLTLAVGDADGDGNPDHEQLTLTFTLMNPAGNP